jgi:putative FmdB family regulatory protein
MPTYEYRCENGHAFEEFQSIVADPVKVCPVCGAHAERHISGGAGLIFKGSGFYITDYGRKGQSASSPAVVPHSSSHSDGNTESKSESTPSVEPAKETKSKSDKPDKSA